MVGMRGSCVTNPMPRPVGKSTVVAVLVLVTLLFTSGCSGGSQRTQSEILNSSRSGTGVTTTQPGPSSSEKAAVILAWTDAEETLYGYSQQPWQQVNADLGDQEVSGQIWPELPVYYSDPALTSEIQFLIRIKNAEIDGPTAYNLGNPRVDSLTSTNATISDCIYDTGTIDSSGNPAPPTLGGGAGYAKGSWQMRDIDSEWKIFEFQTSTVQSCS